MDQLVCDHCADIADRVLHLGSLSAGEQVTLSYPLTDSTRTEEIAGAQYLVHWRGGRVVDIRPHSSGCAPYWWRMHLAAAAH
jgi:hypothetical protein